MAQFLEKVDKAWFSYPTDLPVYTCMLPVGIDNVQQSVPVGSQHICNGSPMYSNLHEMQIKFSTAQTIQLELF